MRKGSHLTEENKLKVSLAKKGRKVNRVYRPLTDEVKLKISNSKKGRRLGYSPWNKGLTKETSPIIARTSNPITNEKKRQSNIRRDFTWGDKVSKAKKGKPLSIAGWNKGLPSWNRGLTKEDDERVAKYAKAGLQRFQNPDWVRYFYERCGNKFNKSEQKLKAILDKNFPNQWEFVGDGKLVIGGKIPDFANINGKKQVIEMFGTYWHNGENPQKRINSFMHFGFATIVIWEHELKNESAIVDKIKNFPNVETLHSAYLSAKSEG